MCGIVGVWDFKNKINPDLLIKTRDTLKHRGPDDAGIFIDEKIILAWDISDSLF